MTQMTHYTLHAYRVGYIIIHTYTHIIYARYAREYQNIVSHVSFEKLKPPEVTFKWRSVDQVFEYAIIKKTDNLLGMSNCFRNFVAD